MLRFSKRSVPEDQMEEQTDDQSRFHGPSLDRLLDNVQDFGATAQKVVVHTRVLMTKPLEDRDSEGCTHGR